MSATASAIDRLLELGGSLSLDGDRIKYRIPAIPEARKLICEIRADRRALIAMLQDREDDPPSLEQVKATLPPGVRLVSYQPKQTPFAVAPVSIVSNAGKFYRTYLADLARRIEKPEGFHCPPLADILGKLADAGLELKIDSA